SPPRNSRSERNSRFFFQAEDGIRDLIVTGVQTCALPISFRVRELLARVKAHIRSAQELARARDEAQSRAAIVDILHEVTDSLKRSEERRVGKECRSGGP